MGLGPSLTSILYFLGLDNLDCILFHLIPNVRVLYYKGVIGVEFIVIQTVWITWIAFWLTLGVRSASFLICINTRHLLCFRKGLFFNINWLDSFYNLRTFFMFDRSIKFFYIFCRLFIYRAIFSTFTFLTFIRFKSTFCVTALLRSLVWRDLDDFVFRKYFFELLPKEDWFFPDILVTLGLFDLLLLHLTI